MNLIAAAVVLLGAITPATARDLPKMADKALYCSAVYRAAAEVISRDGDPASARVIRAYAKNWADISYGFAVGFNRREVNTFMPAYEAEAKADVAAKRYRYNDCGSYKNAD
jgi:hypothetical protein